MQSATNDDIAIRNPNLALFLVSVLALFLELMVIRWVGTEINVFAYLQNTVLVVCFMGLGMGCLTCRQPIVMRDLLIPLLFLVLLLSIPPTRELLGKISLLLSVLGDLVVWKMGLVENTWQTLLAVSAGLIATFVLANLIWGMFIPLGRILGRLMDDHPAPIWAYSINIAGSLLGIWIFVLLSVAFQPPAVWLLIVAALLLPFLWLCGPERRVNLALVFAIAAVSFFSGRDQDLKEVIWSPYQKLALYKTGESLFPFANYFINVNNTTYQWIINLSKDRNPLDHSELREFSQYDIPLLLHPNPRSVLVVGAGSGNDVAAALRHNSRQITAVEIDPAIIDLGRRYHPERPYDSAEVNVVNDDARSFFAVARGPYDVISFGLLDSHTMTGMTNARLDHYIYTKESLQKVKSLLAKGGIITLTFEAQKPFIADRIARVLRDNFGEEPIVFRIPSSSYGVGGVMFIAGDLNSVKRQMAGNQRLASLIDKWRGTDLLSLTYRTPVTTDDWPYLYLQYHQIPLLYYLLAAMMFALFFYTRWRFGLTTLISDWTLTHWHFFFLGAAFLLLEVQNISKAAVVLGNTWLVNAVIISGILVMILFANLIAARWPTIPLGLVYALLVGSCLVLFFTDLARFGFLPYFEKAIVVGLLTALPVLFSGIVFIRSFASADRKDTALGANLIGSLVGGLLQSVTFIIGIKALLLIVAGLYCAAALCTPYFRQADKTVET